ncbi:MAG: nuclear transport factor 2 family protein [Chloroflexi bacterium]|nr:nuclear transport factor 2 family protein [Chloroflexota bacterium]
MYAHRHDSRDVEGYASLFAVDGCFVSARSEYRGRAAVKDFIADLYRSQPADRRTKHLCGNTTVDLDGSTASAITDFVAYERFGDGAWQVHTIGQYRDRLVLEDGEWRFAERRVVTGPTAH